MMMGAAVTMQERLEGISVPAQRGCHSALAFPTAAASGSAMLPHTRAMIAAAAFAYTDGRKVAGVHDHSCGLDLRIAAEARGSQLQGYDGDRAAKFGGALPELFDGGDKSYLSLEIDGLTAKGYDRGSSTHYALKITDQIVQLYDHGHSEWFSFSIQAG